MLTKGQEVQRTARLAGYQDGKRAIPKLETMNEAQYRALVDLSRNAMIAKSAYVLGFTQGLIDSLEELKRDLEHSLQLERSGNMTSSSAKKLVDYRLKHEKREQQQQKRRA